MTEFKIKGYRYTVGSNNAKGYWVLTRYTPAGVRTRVRTTDERLVSGLLNPANIMQHNDSKRLLAFLFTRTRKDFRYVMKPRTGAKWDEKGRNVPERGQG